MLQFMQNFWIDLLVKLAAVAGVSYISWLWSRSFIFFPGRKLAKGLAAYARAELALMASWPSVISARAIDFSCDYVSLILVEQRKSHVLSPKRALSPDDVLVSNDPIVVVSGPGCGKTTLQLHLHHRLMTSLLPRRRKFDVRSISFFMRARDIAESRTTIRDELERKLKHHVDASRLPRLVEAGLAAGWFVVLVDGLDEIKGTNQRFLEELKQFAELYPQCLLMVSSRPISYDLSTLVEHKNRPFREVAIAPLTLKVKRLLIEKYAPDEDCARRILAHISTPFLAELTNVTINLLLLINSVSYAKAIERKSDFYGEAVRVLLQELPERKSIALTYGITEKEEVLAFLCFQSLIWGQPLAKETLWSAGHPLAAKDKVFSEILESSGLLRLVSANRHDFPHRTFSEYFAAVHVVKNRDVLTDEDWARLLVDRCGEIVGFICNLVTCADVIVARVLANAVPKPYLLAVCLAESTEVHELLQEAAERVIWLFLNASSELQVPNSPVRAILSRLHAFPKPKTFRTLYDRLVDQLVRPELSAAGTFGSREEAQTHALRFLVHTRSPEVVPHLVDIFRNPQSDTYVRFKAGELLCELADVHLLPDLERSYAQNTDADVRRFVVEAMVATRSVEAMPLLEVATQDEDLVIQDLAREGLDYVRSGRFLDESPYVRVTDDRMREKFIVPGSDITAAEALNLAVERDSRHRIDAFNFLRKQFPEHGVSKLVKLALNPKENEFFRCEAVRLIGSQPGSDYAQSLVDVFTSPQQNDVRNGAGARGCAIEYLAHRGRRDLVFHCIAVTDVAWRIANERCKIIWSVYEAARQASVAEIREQRNAVLALCEALQDEQNERVLYWRAKVAALVGDEVDVAPRPE